MKKTLTLFILTVLAIMFTLGLSFATVELPRAISYVLSAYFPDIALDFKLIEEFMTYARPIGYACLVAVIALIVVGLKTGRRTLSSLGSIAFFLPTFGYFALSMFFLTGVGILRVLWLPFWDLSTSLLKFGDIIYLPYMILVYPFSLIQLDVRVPLAYLAIGSGLLIFLLGTIAWFYGKSERREIIDFWIYKYSRHPQYIGFLIWSYGVMLLAALSPSPFGGYNPGPSLPWLISALIVICIALSEEIQMTKKYGEEYLKYQRGAPFMLPLPSFISSLVTAPNRVLFNSNLPKRGKQIIYTFAVYSAILILLSLPFLLLEWPPGLGWQGWPSILRPPHPPSLLSP